MSLTERMLQNHKGLQTPNEIDLIQDALMRFGHKYCPYCSMDIGLDRHVEREDIGKWLKERRG